MIISKTEVADILISMGYTKTGMECSSKGCYDQYTKKGSEIWLGFAFIENVNFGHAFPFRPDCNKEELIEYIKG